MFVINIKDMKFKLLIALLGVSMLAACTSTRYATDAEYDDVYYTSKDRANEVDVRPDVSEPTYASRDDYEATRRGYTVDDYYNEDDFYFSRRMRRFNQPNYNSWRYFDPYFSNDLYYVMGTPVWDDWYGNRGWYNWNRPRFGASFGFGFGNPFFNSFGNPYVRRWNSFNYYNPWVNNYYGYDPFFGFNSFNGFNGFNRFGFNDPFFNPFGLGFNSFYAYCPPNAYISSVGNFSRLNVARARRANTRSVASQTTYTGSNRTNTNYRQAPGSTTTSGRSNQGSLRTRDANTSSRTLSTRSSSSDLSYLRPKSEAEKRATVTPAMRRDINRTIDNYNRNRSLDSRSYSPSNGSRRVNTPNSTRSNSNTYTAPRRSTNSRTISTPSRRNNTISTPSRRSNNISTPSRSTRPSTSRPSNYNRSSSRPSVSTPSRSSSSSSRSSSSSSSSSRRRPQ